MKVSLAFGTAVSIFAPSEAVKNGKPNSNLDASKNGAYDQAQNSERVSFKNVR